MHPFIFYILFPKSHNPRYHYTKLIYTYMPSFRATSLSRILIFLNITFIVSSFEFVLLANSSIH